MIKIMIVSFFCLMGIFFGFISPNVTNQLVSGIINMIGIGAFLCQYLYSNIDKIYLCTNKVKQRICNPKFDLIQTMDIKFLNIDMPNDFLEKTLKNLQENMNRKLDTCSKITSKPSKSEGVIALDENGIASIGLYIYESNEDEDDEHHLYIEYKNSVQYNKRINELKFIRCIFEIVSEKMEVINKRHQIKLFFENRNPFYGYILRKGKEINVSNFDLNFSVNNSVNAQVKKHYLEINSSDYGEFNNVIKNIIILANIKDKQ